MSHIGTGCGHRLAETVGTNDASVFAPLGTNDTDSAADSGASLNGQTVADTPALSENSTGEAGSATAAVDVTGTAKVYIYVYAPDNMGTFNINGDANTVLTGLANALANGPAPDEGATGHADAGGAEARVGLTGDSVAEIVVIAPRNMGTINTAANANTTLTGQADAGAFGDGLVLSEAAIDAFLAAQTSEQVFDGNQGSDAISDPIWFF